MGKLNQDRAYSERSHNLFHVRFIQGEHAIENGYFVVSKRLFSLTMELKERSELRFLCTTPQNQYFITRKFRALYVCSS